MTPDLSVIIVSHNGRHWLEPALGSLYDHLGDLEAEVILDDNGSDGAAEHVGGTFPAVKTIRCENRGFAHANNRALETASSRYVLFLNPDTEMLEGDLGAMVAALDRRPRVGLAGVRQLRADGSLAPSIRRFPSIRHTLAESLGVGQWAFAGSSLGERELDPSCYQRETSCDWTSGSFMLVRSEALEEVGWLDERYFLFSEETDLCWRLRHAGWEVVHMPMLTIRHYESDGWENPRLEAQSAYARMQFAGQHFSPIGQFAYRLALGFRYLLRAAVYTTVLRRQAGRRRAVVASLRTVISNRSPFGG